jgi:hypothetical protein
VTDHCYWCGEEGWHQRETYMGVLQFFHSLCWVSCIEESLALGLEHRLDLTNLNKTTNLEGEKT